VGTSELKIISSVAPYVTAANAFESVQLAHADGFSGIELNEDHLHRLAERKPNGLALIRNFASDHRMVNSLHKTLHVPSIDSENEPERQYAVSYTLRTLDYMEQAGIPRIVLHSFTDLPSFFILKTERANSAAYAIASNAIKLYAVAAPVLKAYRKSRADKLQRNFLASLSEISRYAQDKRVNNAEIEVVFEEHYSDSIDYESVPYGKGKFANVIRGIDTAHRLIRTGEKNMDLSDVSGPVHFHAVDTDGWIDDHRTIGTGKVEFRNVISEILKRRLTATAVLENGTRRSVLKSKEALEAMIHRQIQSLAKAPNA
jgi:sugar phosphate isomerase/epimerase